MAARASRCIVEGRPIPARVTLPAASVPTSMPSAWIRLRSTVHINQTAGNVMNSDRGSACPGQISDLREIMPLSLAKLCCGDVISIRPGIVSALKCSNLEALRPARAPTQ
jgi:hypothetical protein